MTFSSDGSTELTDSRLRQLLDDSLADRTERPLDELLRELASATEQFVACGQVAISVLDVVGKIEHFVPLAGNADVAETIGRLTSRGGTLAGVVDSGEIVRVPDVALDERFVGLPPEYAPVRAMLGVPIMLRGRPAGGLYLAQPNNREAFDELDERTAVSIAAAAANLIEKARTAAENARRDRWVTGASQLTRELVTGRHVSPLAVVVERLLEFAEADLVSVIAPGPSDREIVVIAAAGVHAAKWDGQIMSAGGSPVAEVMRTGKAQAIPHVADGALPAGMREALDVDAALLVPLHGTTDKQAVITLSRATGRPAFSAGELGMASMFAGRIALALELAELQAHRDQIAVMDERDRIARDLHDHIIQRLFAVGLTVQSVISATSGRPAQQLRNTVDDIDDTIKQIRSSIYKLTVPIVAQSGSIRAQAAQIIDDLERALGFVPTLDVDGPVDFGIDEDVLDDCVAVLREALTNVARHANATRASVVITVAEGAIILQVQDNGGGVGDVTRRSGLSNLRTRAERRDGTLIVESGTSQGTRLTWSVPIGQPARRD